MKRPALLWLVCAMAVATACRANRSDEAAAPGHVHLSVACGSLGVEQQLCTDAVRAWEQKTGNTVSIVTTPNNSTDRLALYLQMLGSRTADLDVFQIDVVWTGMLASRLADLRPYLKEGTPADFPALVANDTIDGRLVALPWWADVGVLYYRKDLLARYGYSPPKTWQEMTAMARAIQRAERQKGHTGLWGFVFQGRAYEGLTCEALEWIASFGGGTIVDSTGAITVDNPRAVAALTLAGRWVGDISPRGVLNYDEEAARGVFQTGNAVFMRNWPYAWALAQSPDSAVRGRVGVVALPGGGPDGRSAGALGGWQLAVSRFSRHPAEAADLVAFLTSPDQQKKRAIQASYNPAIASLYQDPDVLAANPFVGTLLGPFASAVARPSRVVGASYSELSSEIWRAAHDVLAGEAEPAPRVAALRDELERLKHRARW